MIGVWRWAICAVFLLPAGLRAAEEPTTAELWSLKPVVRPDVPQGLTHSPNPIDAFVAAKYQSQALHPVAQADKQTLLRRVYLDLVGLPPTPAEQEAFEKDSSADAYERVVDHLLASPQYGVRYGRHWLDVLRYADADERMVAAPGIYLWRDWVISALNEDLPYDQFVRAQLTGYRSTVRTQISATGFRSRISPRAEDQFAMGLLARGEVYRDGKDGQELAISAVETVSSAFMGMTVACAKCHDHKYDPIKKSDFYAMKALFDPLETRKMLLATPQQIFAAGKASEEIEKQKAALQKPIDDLIGPFKKKLYDDRVAMLPPEVQAVIRKSEGERTVAEQKIADDYFPVLRIDNDKIMEVMPPDARRQYQKLLSQLNAVGDRGDGALPVFYTVEVNPARLLQKSYELTSGDAARPEMEHPVEPGWPFAPKNIDFRDGRVEAFSDWLTSPTNPLFARVAVNRLWQWHFGQGLQKIPSDFGKLGGTPSNGPLLEWLASELVARYYSMKQINRLIVTSDTYKLSSEEDGQIASADMKTDPEDTNLWHFRLQRLEAEPIWDSVFADSGNLDLTVGGPSFDIGNSGRRGGRRQMASIPTGTNRRAAYMIRGYSTNRDILPNFLQVFDVDDGRVPCPLRTQTVTAPQALFLMNSPIIERESRLFGQRLAKEDNGDLKRAVDLAYEYSLCREPSKEERKSALNFLNDDPNRLGDFAWLMFNLDEFIYVR